jgi:pyruvyltransferase
MSKWAHRAWSNAANSLRSSPLRGTSRLSDAMTSFADSRTPTRLSEAMRRNGILPAASLPLYWFHSRPNFGDELSPFILGSVSGMTPTLVSRRASNKILAVGSILRFLRPGDLVWGAGAIRATPIEPPPGVEFIAVRGPLTRGLIQGDVPETYGDPATLLPQFYSPPMTRRHEVGIVAHARHKDAFDANSDAYHFIDVMQGWQAVVDSIASCDVIISSSLHGIIVAEAYGVPAVWITLEPELAGGTFKFRDYYLSTDREMRPVTWNGDLGKAMRVATKAGPFDFSALVSAWTTYARSFR